LASTATRDVEDVLVADASRGDVQAFAALYDLHADRVFRHLYYQVGNRADAEDLTQQVFLQAWQAIGRFRKTGAPFIAWLFTIAHNLAINAWRRRPDFEPLDLEPVSEAAWADPEAVALADYDREVVRRAILQLKPEQRQVIILRFLEHLDYAQVATAIGKNENNVRLIQHRALLALRGLLREATRS
jgi:RNA polymerase sigma-70 factor (ECF subfamily)